MDVRDPRCLTADALHKRVVVREIGKAPEARAALVRRRLVAVGPGRDVGGAVSQLGSACKIHVDTRTADHEVGCEDTPRRLQFDAATCLSGSLDRRAVMPVKI